MQTLRALELRPEIAVDEVPRPPRMAPDVVAFEGSVTTVHDAEFAATGRFVLLHDPESPEEWLGPWRCVVFARGVQDPELAGDPMLSAVAWSWLEESLMACDAPAAALGGTVTRVESEGHGTLATNPWTVEVEVRASWSPDPATVDRDLQAWAQVLCQIAGLPPGDGSVATLRRK